MSIPVAPALNRRRFLAGSAALGVVAVTGGACSQKEPDWTDLEGKLAGPVIRPRDSRFSRAVEPFNLAYNTPDRRPAAIAMCVNKYDVAAAVSWARDNHRDLVVRAGGHSYAGYSMGRGLMIDVSAMRRFSWDKSRQQLTIESGARNGDIYNVLRAENRTLTHGRCPTVGIAGFLLGGGIGFNMRRYGIGSDLMRGTDIVTADGRLQTISDKDDLFWACRGGGGGNFGINTSFTLDTQPAEPVVVFHITWNGPRDAIADVAVQLMEILDKFGNKLGSRFSFFKVPKIDRAGIDLLGQSYGLKSEIMTGLDDVLRSPTIKDKIIEEKNYWDGQEFLNEWGGPHAFCERSAFLTKNLSRSQIAAAMDWLWKWGGSNDTTIYPDVRFFQTGGAVNAVSPTDTAFVHRDSKWLMDIGLLWSSDDSSSTVAASIKWQNDMFAELSKFGNGESYQNFVDPAFKPDEWGKAYYGKNLMKLSQIKGRYDPANLFKFEQSIRSPTA